MHPKPALVPINAAAIEAWGIIERDVTAWVRGHWFDATKRMDVLSGGKVLFLERFSRRDYSIDSPTAHKMKFAMCCVIDSARGLGPGFWTKKDDENPVVLVSYEDWTEAYRGSGDNTDLYINSEYSNAADAYIECSEKMSAVRSLFKSIDSLEFKRGLQLMEQGASPEEAAREIGWKQPRFSKQFNKLRVKLFEKYPEWKQEKGGGK